MSNLFEEPPVDLLGGLPDPQEAPTGAPEANPDYVNRTALMAALSASTDPTKMDAATEIYRNAILSGQEDSVRLEAARAAQQDDVRSLANLFRDSPGIDPTGELTRGAALAAQITMQRDEAKRAQYALEERTVKRIQDLALAGDANQAETLFNIFQFGDAEGAVREIQAKRLVIAREVERAQASLEDQGWFFDAVDAIASMVPLNGSMSNVGNVDVPKELQRWYDNLWSGQRANDERAALYNMPMDQFVEYVRDHVIPNVKENSTFMGFNNKAEELNLLVGLQHSSPAAVTNILDSLDVIGMVPSVKTLKGVASLPAMLARGGARKEASNLVAQAATDIIANGAEKAAATSGIDVETVVSNLSPSAINPSPSLTGVPLAVNAGTGMTRGQAVLTTLSEFIQPGRFASTVERDKAIASFMSSLETQLERPVKDVKVATTTVTTGQKVTELEITMGRPKGDGYVKERGARTAAASMGYPDAEVFKDVSGQWFFKIRRNLPETGFLTNLEPIGGGTVLGRYLKGSRLISDEFLANAATTSGNTRNKIYKTLLDRFVKPVQNLTGPERDALRQVAIAGNNKERWWTDADLDVLYNRGYGRSPAVHEIEAYRALQELNDVEYALRNDTRWTQLATKGWETVTVNAQNIDILRLNARVDRELAEIPESRVYNWNENIHYNKNNPLTPAELARLKSKGYVLISVDDVVNLKGDIKVKHFIGKPKDLKIEPLRRDQIGYREGGHTMYRGKYFARQTVIRIQGDTANEVLLNPKTYRVFDTQAEAKVWSATMEEARLAAAKGISGQEIDTLIFKGHTGYPTGDEFLKGLKDGTYEEKASFVHTFDREMPEEYQPGFSDAERFVNEDETGFDGYLRTTGQMYTGNKGVKLKDFAGAQAPTLDPFETIDTSINNILSVTSFADYKLQAVERWAQTYGKYLIKELKDASPHRQLANAVFDKETDIRIINEGMAQKEIIARTLSWKSAFDRQGEALMRSLIERVNGENPFSVRNKMAQQMMHWWDTTNPVAALRGIAFDMKMGMFNPIQLPLQIGTAVAAMALSPKHGMNGFGLAHFIRVYMTKSGTENYLDHLVKNGWHKTLGGFDDPAEFKDFMRLVKRSGATEVNGTHALINDYGPHAAYHGTSNAIERFREGGRVFFNLGEEINLNVAATIAWKELRERFPHLATNSEEFITKWEGRVEDYSFGMKRESQASWQRGVMSIPTQFMSYNARMIEAMLFDPKFTPRQKLHLFVSQAILYGAAGVPITPFVVDYMNGKEGSTPDLNSAGGIFQRGLVDWFWNNVLGTDVEISKRFGTGSFWTDLLMDLSGHSKYGEKSFLEVIGGPTAKILFGDVMGPAVEAVINYSIAESGGDTGRPVTRDTVTGLASNITTLSNIHKAYMVFRYGTLMSKNGTTIANDVPQREAFAILLGLQPHVATDLAAAKEFRNHEKEIITEAAQVIRNLRTRMINEPGNRLALADQINLYVKTLPPSIRAKALERAHGQIDPSLYDTMVRQVQKSKAEEDLMEQTSELEAQ